MGAWKVRKKHSPNRNPETPHPPNPSASKPHLKPRKKPSKKPRKKPSKKPRNPTTPAQESDSGSDSPAPSSPASVRRLLEPYPKARLLTLLADAAVGDAALVARLRAAADESPSHRKLFVHGLPPDATGAALAGAFSRFGAVNDCNVVADRASGHCRGYGFVLFTSRAAARRALRAPSLLVGVCPVSAQLASVGPSGAGGAERRVYVGNVAHDASPGRLRAFFAQFGELEGGPFGFDAVTGKSCGYALFVYRTAESAKKALAEPNRVFEGRTLHCQVANDPAQKNKAPVVSPAPAASANVTPPPPLQPVVAAVAAAGAQNLALYAQNSAYASALLGQNPLFAAAALNPAVAAAAAALSPPAAMAAMANGGGAGLLGAYKPPAASSLGKKGTILGTSVEGFPGYPW